MSWYEYLTPCEYFGDCGDQLVAVGWLEPGHSYYQSEIEPEFLDRLVELLQNPWQPGCFAAVHRCGSCRLSGGPAEFSHKGTSVRMGVSNLFVPVGGLIFAAPSLILHYMDSHGYSPPVEVCKAVVRCPPMRSIEYLRAILKHGPKEFVRMGR